MNIEEIAAKAKILSDEVTSAVSTCNCNTDVIQCYVQTFGGRMPTNEAWVIPVVTDAATLVRNTPARRVKPDPIKNTRAG